MNLIPIPEEIYEDEVDAMRLDVYQLGAVAYQVAFRNSLQKDESCLIWREPQNDPYNGMLTDWLKSAINMDSSHRFASSNEMMDALSKLALSQAKDEPDGDQAIMRELSKYIKELIPFISWPPSSEVIFKDGRQTYQSALEGVQVTIRLWPRLMPRPGNYAQNRKIYEFIKRCQTVQQFFCIVPPILDFGISANGLFVVQKYISGQTLEHKIEFKTAKDQSAFDMRLALANKLVSAVKLLHEAGLTHGDLKPDNILIEDTSDGENIVFLDFFDLDQHGNRLYNTEYAPQRQHGEKGRDVYATYLIIDEIFSRCGDGAKLIRQEIARALGDDLQTVPISLTPLQQTIDKVMSASQEVIEELIFYEGGALNSQKSVIPFSGEFYVALKNNRQNFRLYLLGAKEKMVIHAEKQDGKIRVIKKHLVPIYPAEILDESKKRQVKRIKCNISWHKGQGDNTPFFQRIFSLFEIDPSESIADIDRLSIPVAEQAEFDLSALWSRLLMAEYEQYTIVTPAEDGKRQKGGVSVKIDENIFDFNYNSDDNIEVTDGDPDHPYVFGELELSKSSPESIFINSNPSNKKIRKGDRLQLRERLSAISWRRRRSALDRVLKNEALIPNLYFRFSSYCRSNHEELIQLPEPKQELWDIYKNKLDNSQRDAFKHVLSGRLNVIMGPPGTGKTTLLSVLLDYFSRLNGSSGRSVPEGEKVRRA